jgi:competence protein ComEC
MNKTNYNKIFLGVIGFLALINVFIWSYPKEHIPGVLSVIFLDVGQGDAIFIEAPNGKQLLIDGGRNSSVVRELSNFMSFNDREIDVLLATHSDSDHIGGFPEVFDRFSVLNYVDNGRESLEYLYREVMSRVSSRGSRYVKGERGLVIVLDKKKGVYFQVLFPAKNFSLDNENEMSVVGRLVYGDTSFMLTGDAGKLVENILVYADGELLRSDVLKAGHHGSKSSSGLLFVETVAPKYSIISASASNSYGHPHGGVIANLEKVGSTVLETSKEGSIVFQSDGRSVWRK